MTIKEFSKDLQIKLTPYLAYNLKFVTTNRKPRETKFSLCSGLITETNKSSFGLKQYTGISEYKIFNKNFLPVLNPISDLLDKLDFFEIGDDNNYSIEFDNGNIKLITNLESIAKNKDYFDIQFLPYAVVQKLIEWHIDIFGLIDKGLAVSSHDVKQVIA